MLKKLKRLLHLHGIHVRFNWFLVNRVYAGTESKHFEKKRRLLNAIGHDIGEGTRIVGPIQCYEKLTIGKNCWIGKNLILNGNGNVVIGDNCDIAPEVTFLTGGHEIGFHERRAGEGISYSIVVGNGVWIGARSTILGNTKIEDGAVIAACACVNKDVNADTLVGGVPAKMIRKLENGEIKATFKQ